MCSAADELFTSFFFLGGGILIYLESWRYHGRERCYRIITGMEQEITGENAQKTTAMSL